jgi:uncharacterized protein (TIGR04255 family)
MAPFPSFKNPPVNEVVCGVRFRPSEKFRIAHIGLLWKRFKDEYPIVQHASPLASAAGELLVDASTGTPLPRVWFINDTGDKLIQFQGDRFYFNWRRKKDKYPRYGNIVHNFDMLVCNIVDFNKEFEFGEIEPIDYELTYINHIEKGHGWETTEDLPHVFKDFRWNHARDRFLPKPDKIAWNTSFILPNDYGRLIVNLKQGIRKEDRLPLLLFELKTSGLGNSAKIEHYRKWFDLSREWIVRGFADLTTSEQHKIWEREDNA